VVVANEESVQKHHLTPLLRILGWNSVGCDPTIMGIGPVEAIRNLCKKTGIPLDKIDLIEVDQRTIKSKIGINLWVFSSFR
jgi:acetyl-CoA acyltransferase 2